MVGTTLAATLSSTGTPAHFLHSTEALHDGVGCLCDGDVVIAISNSGKTDEVCCLRRRRPISTWRWNATLGRRLLGDGADRG